MASESGLDHPACRERIGKRRQPGQLRCGQLLCKTTKPKRITFCGGNDPCRNLGPDGRRNQRGQELTGRTVIKPFHDHFRQSLDGKPSHEGVSYAKRQYNPIGLETTPDKRQGCHRVGIQPIRVVDHNQQRRTPFRVTQEGQGCEPHKESICPS